MWDEQTAGIFSKCKVKSVLLKGASSPMLLRLRFHQPLQLSCSLSRDKCRIHCCIPSALALCSPPQKVPSERAGLEQTTAPSDPTLCQSGRVPFQGPGKKRGRARLGQAGERLPLFSAVATAELLRWVLCSPSVSRLQVFRRIQKSRLLCDVS